MFRPVTVPIVGITIVAGAIVWSQVRGHAALAPTNLARPSLQPAAV